MTLDYLKLTGRAPAHVRLVEEYAKEQGLFRNEAAPPAGYDETIELDLRLVEPSLAGPRRPQDRVSLQNAKTGFQSALSSMMIDKKGKSASSSAAASSGTVAVLEAPPVIAEGLGNSGPLPDDVSAIVAEKNLVVCSVLSGNRNFEGRIQSQVRANYLASPPLVVAYALAGRMTIDLTSEPIGKDAAGKDVFLRELWPSEREIQEAMLGAVKSDMFKAQYGNVFDGDERWRSLQVPTGDRFQWDERSTYIRRPPFV